MDMMDRTDGNDENAFSGLVAEREAEKARIRRDEMVARWHHRPDVP
jgi:hypothetical protein